MLVELWRGIRRAFSVRKSNRRRQSNAAGQISLRGEYLERRELLSANQIAFNPTLSLIVVEGTSGADSVNVWTDVENILHVSMSNSISTQAAGFARATVSQVRFVGGDGDDTFVNTSNVDTLAFGDGGNDTLDGGSGGSSLFGGNGDDRLFGGINVDYLYGGDGVDLLVGGSGDDHLEGGIANDLLYGGLGNDTLSGDDGDDSLYGEEGVDSLTGGNGNDFLGGGIGDDTLFGGTGNDVIRGDDGNDRVYGEDDADWLYGGSGDDLLEGDSGDDTLLGGGGNDTLTSGDGDDSLYGDDGIDLLTGDNGNDFLGGGIGDDTLFGGTGNDVIRGDDGNDRVYGEDGVDWLYGDNGDDLLEGGIANDLLLGGFGNDTLTSGDGDDSLYGDDGIDLLTGDNGNDFLGGGIGDDTLFGGTGNDVIRGDDGNDRVYGEDGVDWLYGDNGDDLLEGGIANDLLLGGFGNDTLSGDDGDDSLYGEEGVDSLTGGNGNDFLGGGIGDDTLFGGTGNDVIRGDDGNDRVYGEDDADWLYGDNGDDLLEGGIANDLLLGGFGNDTLTSGDGDDSLYGDDGIDLLTGDNGNDFLGGGIGDDTLFGGTGNDVIRGDDGNDRVYGEDDADWLYGGSGDDLLEGDSGDDTLLGGGGNDTLTSGDGDDSLYGEDGVDLLTGDNGNDFLGGGIGDDTLFGGTGNDVIRGDDGNDRVYGEDDADWLYGGSGDDLLEGDSGDDTLLGGGGNDTLTSGDGDDSLYGDDGIDLLTGDNGNDFLGGGIGDDTLFGGTGNDVIRGDDGNDRVYGEDDADWLYGGSGDDLLEGDSGDDTLLGGGGNDTLTSGDGDDSLYGEDGVDLLTGGNGNDSINGGAFDDTIFAGTGNDVMQGEDGNDFLYGEEDMDVVVGGAGNDMVFGGTGIDVVIGSAGQDQVYGDNGEDLLIGGSTAFDGDISKLRSLITTWSTPLPYATRIQLLESEFSTTHLQLDETVFDDQVSDTLYGGADQDWFFETGTIITYRPADVEPYVPDMHEDHHHTELISAALPTLEGFAFVDSLDKLSDRATDETVNTVVPHANDPSLQREHLSLTQLVRYDQVTSYAVSSGAWSNPSTWSNGVVPAGGARVLIPIGVHVQVDGVIATRIATIRVDGELSFNTTRNTELRVDTIVVTGSGAFEMGTDTSPIVSGVTARLLITDNGPIDRTWDPFGISRGLISHGRVSMFGAEVSPYAALALPATAGSIALTLKTAPVGWKVGDSLVIAATSQGTTQNEVRRITAILGSVVTLDQSLSYTHSSPSSDLEVHVANTTRNATIESESTTIEQRGHVMFMHNRDVHVSYGGFYKLGRTDKTKPINDAVVNSDWTLKAGTGTNVRGRYSVHFHRNGVVDDGSPSTIIGSAVVDSPGWGFVNHTSYVNMIGNVAFDVHGSAFATEVGNEIGGFYGNIAIGATGSTEEINARQSIQDFGFQGDGFWFQGAGVSVVGNIAAGNQGNAFVFYTRGLIEGGVQQRFLTANLPDPTIANGADTIDIGSVPMRPFSGNIGYGSHFGLLVRYHLETPLHTKTSVFENSTFWNNEVGVYLPYSQHIVLRNLKLITNATPRPYLGVTSNLSTLNITYDNLAISGYHIGIDLPRRGVNVVSGGTFNTVTDLVLYTAVISDRVTYITGLPTSTKIAAVQETTGYGPVSTFFVNDVNILNFGSFVYQRLYFNDQLPNYVPFPAPRPDAPAAYIGLTNQQIWDQFGVAIGGSMVPSNAYTVPTITGWITSPA